MSNLTRAAYINNVTNDMNKYFVLVSSTIGIPCNLISIFIFARLTRNKTNMGFLYVCQCIVDLFLLLVMLLVVRSWPTIFYYNFMNMSDALCKLLTYMKRFTVHISSWMTVLITFDRLIFVLHGQNQKFRFMKRKRYLSFIILVMFICLGIADIPNLFFQLTAGTKIGNSNCSGSFGIVFSSDMISTFLRTYIPLFLMLCCNIIMKRKVFDNKLKAVRQHTSLNKKENQFTFAVMAYDVYFFEVNSPLAIFYIFYDVNLYTDALTGDYGAMYNLLYFIFANLSFLQQTLSFFMNFAFNKHFRSEILTLIRRCFGILKLTRIQPTFSTSHNTSLRANNS
jgi:hypothetical protein